ncbi:nitroreductase family protein [Phytohabitans sp. LJ34]|uniref:nitroreductase family protein n=1 Tax=Phytohabitans sp. LJ34 TaxID=3452217 RepID=UPI003F8BDF42
MTTSLTREEIADLCAAGVAAPSGGNAQPWRVTVAGDRLEVGADPARGSFLDVGGYASAFAVGCFAENVAVAARARGLDHTVAVREGTVVFTFTGRRDAAPEPLAAAVPERVTNRRLHKGPPLDDERVRRLAAAASAADPSSAVSAVSDPDGKRVVAEALGLADAVRMRHRAMFDDMVREIRWSEREARGRLDGLDVRSLDLPAATRALLPVLRRLPWVRRLLPAARLGDTARALVRGCSHVCCLYTTAGSTPDAMVAAGRATQRLWLEATRAGVAVHPWTVSTLELLRLEAFRGEGFTPSEQRAVAWMGGLLRAAFDVPAKARPVFVFRLSTAPPPAVRALRRPWQTFTTIQEGQ